MVYIDNNIYMIPRDTITDFTIKVRFDIKSYRINCAWGSNVTTDFEEFEQK